MPIYEFECNECGQRVSHFQRRIADTAAPACPRCRSQNLRRLVSRFAVVRSAEDSFDDSDLDGLDGDDPEAMARWARSMGDEIGEDLGSEFDAPLGGLGGGAGLDEPGMDGFDDEA